MEILQLRCSHGHGEYDRLVTAPEGMAAEEAWDIVNTEIKRANDDHPRTRKTGDVCCDDVSGRCVEKIVIAELTKLGFVFFTPRSTFCWDEVMR